MNTKHTLSIVSVGVVGMLTFAGTASAAQTEVDLATAKAKCEAAITDRTTEIDKLTARANSAAHLSAGHLGTINSFLSASTSGLTDLYATIDADTDAASLKTHCQSVFADFRIFALRSPQVHLAIVGDRASVVESKLDSVATKLDAAIQTAIGNGKDVSDAAAKLNDMNAKLADAESLLNGVVDNELALTPANWNADHTVLSSTTSALKGVQADLVTALADAKAIVADLKA